MGKKGFKNKKNPDLWLRFLKIYNKHVIKFFWVKGHNNNPLNERCDYLAVEASKSLNLTLILNMKNNILITGTVAFDDIETPFGKSGTIVGGAATYIGLAASFFKKLAIVSVIGEDFPIDEISFLNERNINTDMIQIIKVAKHFTGKESITKTW